ncbi:MAG: GlmU family protein [Bacteroidota bacterium]
MLVFFDLPQTHQALLPLTFTRPLSELRIGILMIREKWQKHLEINSYSYLTADWLMESYPFETSSTFWYINGAVCPTPELVEVVRDLREEEILVDKHQNILAIHTKTALEEAIEVLDFPSDDTKTIIFREKFTYLHRPCDVFMNNRDELILDFDLLTKRRESQPLQDPHTRIYNPEQIFLEEGATVRSAVLNADAGPIYIGKNAEICEGSVIRGAFALGENAVLNMGTKIKGDTTIGPWCKVGGEISNSVLIGYSNKGHEGFLGNSVLGEWCNLGADTNISNLKNNYSEIKVWDYEVEDFKATGLIFHGLVMGDHAKSGINTMFNTGTIVGVGANIFGGGFPPKFVPSFSWGGALGLQTFRLEKFFEMAERMMQRRKREISPIEKKMLTEIFEHTQRYRGQ